MQANCSLALVLVTLAIYSQAINANPEEENLEAVPVNSEPQEDVAIPLIDQYVPPEHMVSYLREMIVQEVNRRPDLYDPVDIKNVVESSNEWHARRFLEQRSYDLGRAYQLAIKTLRWRRKYELSSLRPENFPCDIFALGLIFEHGVSNDIIHEGQRFPGVPVIWLRMGALGRVVKKLESYSPKRIVANYARSMYSLAKGTIKFLDKFHGRQPHDFEKPEVTLTKNGAAADHPAINFILRAIAWWIQDWEQRHNYESDAILLIDFENHGGVFSSFSVMDFVVGLDDRFPGLFDQIIGFRHKTNLLSLHAPAQLHNKVLGSRILSSMETDSKLRYASSRNELAQYIPIATFHEGIDLLPEHVRGDCAGFYKDVPLGCNHDVIQFEMNAPFDVRVLQEVKTEFYNRCEPRMVNLINPLNRYR